MNGCQKRDLDLAQLWYQAKDRVRIYVARRGFVGMTGPACADKESALNNCALTKDSTKKALSAKMRYERMCRSIVTGNGPTEERIFRHSI